MRQSSFPISFPTLQVVSDLRSVAAQSFSALSEHLNGAAKQALRRVIFDQRCLLNTRDADVLHSDLLLVAAMPDKGIEAFVAATVVLLADRVQGGAGQDDLYWNFDAFQDHYQKAHAPVRAALMNGFRCAHTSRKVKLDHPPQGRALQTFDSDDLIRLLKRIARSMSPEVRDLVSQSGPQDTVAVHRKALENCLQGSCILSEFGGWFPGEVVEKVSLDPQHPGHAGCTTLVLLDAITTRDAGGKMAFRWEEQAEIYLRMPPELRVPITAAVRHLHEMGFDWRPYSDWPGEKILQKAVVVPFAKP
jgi:hypothetical protein